MKIQQIVDILHATVYCGKNSLDYDIEEAFASDMMSDVLAYVKKQDLLVTGLCNPQTIRTAIMLDMKCILLVRGKVPSPEMINLAKINDIVLLSSEYKMFRACGILYQEGIVSGEYSI